MPFFEGPGRPGEIPHQRGVRLPNRLVVERRREGIQERHLGVAPPALPLEKRAVTISKFEEVVGRAPGRPAFRVQFRVEHHDAAAGTCFRPGRGQQVRRALAHRAHHEDRLRFACQGVGHLETERAPGVGPVLLHEVVLEKSRRLQPEAVDEIREHHLVGIEPEDPARLVSVNVECPPLAPGDRFRIPVTPGERVQVRQVLEPPVFPPHGVLAASCSRARRRKSTQFRRHAPPEILPDTFPAFAVLRQTPGALQVPSKLSVVDIPGRALAVERQADVVLGKAVPKKRALHPVVVRNGVPARRRMTGQVDLVVRALRPGG